MMNDELKWEEIEKPSGDINVRRVPNESNLLMYIGKDIDGRCLFIIELEGDHIKYFKKNVVKLLGIEVDLRSAGANQRLFLILESQINRDLFGSLCISLIGVLKNVKDSSVGLSIVFEHLKRWKAFLSAKKVKRLSPEEVRGLFAELEFLKRLLKSFPNDMRTLLEAWLGPEASHQDFIFSNTAIEIKALSGRERNTVKISSEDQLEGLSDNLFLKIYRLDEHQSIPGTTSLNGQIKDINGILVDPDDQELFLEKLSSAGYLPLDIYEDTHFQVLDEKTYKVVPEFPKIASSALAEGISKVRYEIGLQALEQFICDNKIDWRK